MHFVLFILLCDNICVYYIYLENKKGIKLIIKFSRIHLEILFSLHTLFIEWWYTKSILNRFQNIIQRKILAFFLQIYPIFSIFCHRIPTDPCRYWIDTYYAVANLSQNVTRMSQNVTQVSPACHQGVTRVSLIYHRLVTKFDVFCMWWCWYYIAGIFMMVEQPSWSLKKWQARTFASPRISWPYFFDRNSVWVIFINNI